MVDESCYVKYKWKKIFQICMQNEKTLFEIVNALQDFYITFFEKKNLFFRLLIIFLMP